MGQKWRDWQIDQILLLGPILSCAYYTNASNVVTKDMPLNVALEKVTSTTNAAFSRAIVKEYFFFGFGTSANKMRVAQP